MLPDRARLVTTILADGWDGASSIGKDTKEHGSRSQHQLSIVCSEVPSAGIIMVRGRPREGVGFGKISDEAEEIDLTSLGSARLVYTGFFDAYQMTALTPVVGATVTIALSSVAEELLETT